MFDTGFIDSYFSRNYIGATNNSIIRGAYHFARPSVSSGAAQAEYFLAHGGKAHTLVTAVRFLTLSGYRWVDRRWNHAPRSHRSRRYHLQSPNLEKKILTFEIVVL